MGSRDVPSQCRPCCSALSEPSLMLCPVPVWLSGRCFRCLLSGHRAAACRDPIRCSRCLRSGHRARECVNAWQPLSSLPGLAVSSQPQLVVHPCRGMKPVEQPPPLRHPATPPPRATSDVQSSLAEQAMLLRTELHGCLARVECFLVRAGAALGASQVAPEVSPPAELNSGSADIGEEGIYGGFSPRVSSPCLLSDRKSVV